MKLWVANAYTLRWGARCRPWRADHVNYLGLGSAKDPRTGSLWLLRSRGIQVCNQQSLRLFSSSWTREALHPGVIVIVPSVTPLRQRELFPAPVQQIGARDLANSGVEVHYAGSPIAGSEYALPKGAD